jgi:hypothetical protein
MPCPFRMLARALGAPQRANARTTPTFPASRAFIPSNLGHQGSVPRYARSERAELPPAGGNRSPAVPARAGQHA